MKAEWLTLYRFDRQPQRAVDFEAANFQLVHDPSSHFRNALICALATPTARLALRDLELAIHHRDGRTDRRTLAGADELLEVLARDFGIAIDRVDGLAERAASLG